MRFLTIFCQVRSLNYGGKIYVKANSLSSRSLLIMEKTRIIKDWNSFFKDAPIKEIVVVKGY